MRCGGAALYSRAGVGDGEERMFCPCHACRLWPRQRKPHTLLPQHLLQHDRARGCMAVDVERLNNAGKGGVIVALGHHHAAVAGGAHAHTHTHTGRGQGIIHNHTATSTTTALTRAAHPRFLAAVRRLWHTPENAVDTPATVNAQRLHANTRTCNTTPTHVRWCCANGDDDSSPRLAVPFTQLGGVSFALARLTTCGRALVRRAIARPNTATLAWGGCRCARL